MKRYIFLFILLALTGGAVALLMSNRQKQQAQIAAARKPLPVAEAAPTSVASPAIAEPNSYVGRSEAWRELTMNATTQGTIRVLNAQLNAPVQAGQVVVQIDTDLIQIQITQAEAQVRKANLDLSRFEALHRENNLPTAELETARLQVVNAEAQLQTLRKQLADATVKAPIGGLVTDKPVEKGMFIAPGSPLLTLTDVSQVRVVIPVPESDLNLFRAGRRVRVTFDAYPDRPLVGVVNMIRLKGGEVNTASAAQAGLAPVGVGRFPVEIRVANSAQTPLRVGMTATVTLP